jgi:hypothetical protein
VSGERVSTEERKGSSWCGVKRGKRKGRWRKKETYTLLHCDLTPDIPRILPL